jgi:hypothetical protein
VVLSLGSLSSLGDTRPELNHRVTQIRDITTIREWPAGKIGYLPEPLAQFVEQTAEGLAKEPGVEAAFGRDLKASSLLGSHIAVDLCPEKRLWLLHPYFGASLDPSYFPTVHVAIETLPEGTCSQPIPVDMRFFGIAESGGIPLEIVHIKGTRCPLVAVSMVEHPGTGLYTGYRIFFSVDSHIEPQVVFAYIDRENDAEGACPREAETIVRDVREIARDHLSVTVNAVLRNGDEVNLGSVRYERDPERQVYVPTNLEAAAGRSATCLVSAKGKSYASLLQRREWASGVTGHCH